MGGVGVAPTSIGMMKASMYFSFSMVLATISSGGISTSAKTLQTSVATPPGSYTPGKPS
jgi:hypothetical protein